MIFVDTGAWFARFVPDDPQHQNMVQWFTNNDQPLVTSDYCIDETLTLLSIRKRAQLALEAGSQFFDETMAAICFLEKSQIERTWILFQQRAKAGWSFTDCTSKIVITDLKIQKAVAFDQHFQQFGIEILP